MISSFLRGGYLGEPLLRDTPSLDLRYLKEVGHTENPKVTIHGQGQGWQVHPRRRGPSSNTVRYSYDGVEQSSINSSDFYGELDSRRSSLNEFFTTSVETRRQLPEQFDEQEEQDQAGTTPQFLDRTVRGILSVLDSNSSQQEVSSDDPQTIVEGQYVTDPHALGPLNHFPIAGLDFYTPEENTGGPVQMELWEPSAYHSPERFIDDHPSTIYNNSHAQGNLVNPEAHELQHITVGNSGQVDLVSNLDFNPNAFRTDPYALNLEVPPVQPLIPSFALAPQASQTNPQAFTYDQWIETSYQENPEEEPMTGLRHDGTGVFLVRDGDRLFRVVQWGDRRPFTGPAMRFR
ncbi:hypothetical protein UCRPC4_g05424 [Phaeomoniella chlamydospora]|uniref:Uncharacterized protein n=1 Tax=Phaeomoniella chlamydospora TaxID=158046 RepID=A0A0G2E620_PHACM|nr:hypothetical protein UCRPC4_g05424 [Phaeomoniella chlamydospora]